METRELDQSVLFEDEYLVVLNKPAGWVVNRSATYAEPTVQDWMEARLGLASHPQVQIPNTNTGADSDNEYGTPEEIFAQRGGVAHRLDKDTSGVLLLAKTPVVLAELMRQFRDKEIKKKYLALVHGKVTPSEGTIRLPMDRSETDFKKFAVRADGRMSETEYKVKTHFPGLPSGIAPRKGKSYQGFSLLELWPKTGRTHQIRVHMSAIRHPLVADSTYAGRKKVKVDYEWCPRHFLHASELCFTHPVSQKQMCFEAPLPEDLKGSLDRFNIST